MNGTEKRAIVDIGSNSIRLVIFGGALRAPTIYYNEKFSAGLGRSVLASGALDPEKMADALATLARFSTLIKLMQVPHVKVVATAAVRDASNGPDFIRQVKKAGLPVRILSGEEEATASAHGVISAIPHADGIIADLGGGSLELARVRNGQVSNPVSLPLGILRVSQIRASGQGKLAKIVEKQIASLGWVADAKDLPLYLVGGSWRALGRVHIHGTGFPLPVAANHIMPTDAGIFLRKYLKDRDQEELRQIPRLPPSRLPMLEDSAAMLDAMAKAIRPSQFVICASGLREGLLFEALPEKIRAEDPLVSGARFTAEQHRRFPGYGEALGQWLDRAFGNEGHELVRLRDTAALLADLGWASTPEFRALGGEELALHGSWMGVHAQDRAMLAMALFSSFGGNEDATPLLHQLAPAKLLHRAHIWGLAIRLAHRLSGGTAEALGKCHLLHDGDTLLLRISGKYGPLDNISVRRRLERLGAALGLQTEIRIV